MRYLLLVWLPLVTFPGGLAAQEKVSQREELPSPVDVYVSGVGGYHTYRIPSLLTTSKGTLLAFTEGRKTSREDLGDNDMLLRRSTDHGHSWSKTQLVYEEGGSRRVTIGNPTAVLDESTGIVWLVVQRDGRDVLVTHSRDDGRTWVKPTNITSSVKKAAWGFYAVGPGVGIQIRHGPQRGRLVIPAYHRLTKDKSGPSRAHMFYSDDHGKSWRLGNDTGEHLNECQVAEVLAEGASRLLLNARNHWGRSGNRPDLAGTRIVVRSNDGGQTWEKPAFDKKLIVRQCQGSLIRYSWKGPNEASRLLFCNPAARSRSNLTLRLSFDEGLTWTRQRLIYKGLSAYCALARLANGNIGILYERDSYARISFQQVPLAWLEAGK